MKDFKFQDAQTPFTLPADTFVEAYLSALNGGGECIPLPIENHGENQYSPIILVELDGGNLRILVNPFNADAISDLQEMRSKNYDITADILEDGRYIGNDWHVVDPCDIGALTDSPIIGYGIMYDGDTDEIEGFEKIWWFPNYQVVDPYDLLIENGFVDFEKA